jgi:hypothetical protein
VLPIAEYLLQDSGNPRSVGGMQNAEPALHQILFYRGEFVQANDRSGEESSATPVGDGHVVWRSMLLGGHTSEKYIRIAGIKEHEGGT